MNNEQVYILSKPSTKENVFLIFILKKKSILKQHMFVLKQICYQKTEKEMAIKSYVNSYC